MKYRTRGGFATAVTGLWLLLVAGQCGAATDELQYDLTFELRLTANRSRAEASIEVRQSSRLLHEIRMKAPPPRYGEFQGDGVIRRKGDYITWQPPAAGGRIKYSVAIDHERANGAFDALITPTWAIFRVDDIFPAARTKHRSGSHSRSTLRLKTPADWSVTTPFPDHADGGYLIDNPARSFDRPTGWVIAGKVGRRRDLISGVDVTVTAPLGAGVQRIAMLALLRWTLPHLTREIDPVRNRLSIVVGGAPMWRGGLSAPNSIFVHADRPLLSENGTSTLLHEVVHVMMPLSTADKHDWIDEGIAEYMTLKLLRDSGTISEERFAKAISDFDARGVPATELETTNASGAITARAVTIFYALDTELLKTTDGEADLFTLLRLLRKGDGDINPATLTAAASELTGLRELDSLAFLTSARTEDD